MENRNIVLIAAAAVAIIAIAAAAVALNGGSGNSGGNGPDVDTKDYGEWEPASLDIGLLTVFGNANGDSVINSDDIALLKKAIPLFSDLSNAQSALTSAKNAYSKDSSEANKSALDSAQAAFDRAQAAFDNLELPTLSAAKTYKGDVAEYYLADANCDGKINSLDLAIVEKIVRIQGNVHNYNGGDNLASISYAKLAELGIESVNIYYYDVDSVLAQFSYPLTGDMAVGYKSNYESILILGANGRATYACNQVSSGDSIYYQWYHKYFENAKDIGSRFTPDYEVFVEGGAPQMFVTGTRAWFDGNMETTLAPLNVSVVRLPFWEDNICDSSIVTFGFLICCQEASYAYSQKVTDVVNAINAAVKDIPLEDRPLVFQSYNGTSISTMHNGIHEAVYLAGGKTPYDVGYTNGSIDIEEISSAGNMNPDYIGLDQYYGFLENWDVNNKEASFEKMKTQLYETANKYVQAIKNSNAWAEGKVFAFNQGTFMGPASYITIAYMFNCIYADQISDGKMKAFDVDALFSDYLASYHSEYTIDDFIVNGINVQYYSLIDLDKLVNGNA